MDAWTEPLAQRTWSGRSAAAIFFLLVCCLGVRGPDALMHAYPLLVHRAVVPLLQRPSRSNFLVDKSVREVVQERLFTRYCCCQNASVT